MDDTRSRYNEQEPGSLLEGLPARLAQVLAFAGISQAELTRRIGMSQGFVSDVLRGVKRPGPEFLLALRKSFGVSIDWLLTGEGTMVGGSGIRADLFQAIRLQIAVARAAVIESNPTAQALAILIREGQLSAAAKEPAFNALLSGMLPDNTDLDLAIELYNGQQWATDPISQRRNLLAAAFAHFETKRPRDHLAAITGMEQAPTVTQVNSGAGQRISGRDYIEHRRNKK